MEHWSQALEKSQLRIGQLTTQNRQLQERVDALTIEVTALRGNSSKKKKNPGQTIPYADVLKDLGKKFAIMEEPWLRPSIFSVPLTINADLNPAARFVDDETYDKGTIEFLHQFVPNKFHDDMVNLSEFAKTVSVIFSDDHSLLISHHS